MSQRIRPAASVIYHCGCGTCACIAEVGKAAQTCGSCAAGRHSGMGDDRS